MPTTIDPLARLEAVDAALKERIPSAGGACFPSGKAAQHFLIESERRMNDPNEPTERQARALELRRAGWKWRQIMQELGCSHGSAHIMVQTALLKEKRREKLEGRRAREQAGEV
jgi:hypothetical protein